ncbi:MAG: hypothetical protein UX48_C0047G0002 [Candidatus Azambacteria bacterium GW2011_GWB1_46_27]|uniref:O-antigen polymerase n=1 Tax=Candidatus Azambacteria bacterium GW2011_GWB1_46_27 TaxID=1618617 RepID=A0A0G1SJF5_9BACT|nr:MAG: hypothetical protein UX48_C0047G0002 [Candidatus Azambacteria bacterium GW2011_GWB1_46_27]
MLHLLYVIPALLPLYLIKISVFTIPFTVLELAIYALFLIWFFQKKETFSFKNFPWPPVALLLAGLIVSTLFSQNQTISLGIMKGWFFASLVFAFVASQVLKTERQIKGVFAALVFGGAGIALVGFYYFFIGDLTFDGRLQAFYLSPNHMAMAVAPALLAGLWFLLSAKSSAEKAAWGLSSALIFFAFYFTYSYAGWMAAFFGVLFLIFFSGVVANRFSGGRREIFKYFQRARPVRVAADDMDRGRGIDKRASDCRNRARNVPGGVSCPPAAISAVS